MRTIEAETLKKAVYELCLKAAIEVDPLAFLRIQEAYKKETGLAKEILGQIIENDQLAKEERIPLCQDTGIVVCFVEIGNEIYLPFDLEHLINEGIGQAYLDGYLRKSVVSNPLDRKNTMNNTPGIIHTKIVLGDSLKITIAPKGAGSENMSRVKMLVPSDGIKGIKQFVIDSIKEMGGKPCPPLIVGIGIGGDFEKAAILSKEALLRSLDDHSNDSKAASLEQELLEEINELEIGPMGLGGKTTALAVKVNLYPCHIASLPVAINVQCHASRHWEVIL